MAAVWLKGRCLPRTAASFGFQNDDHFHVQIELMVHRRLLQDDGLGVMEPLNETDAGCSPYPTQVPDWTSLCAPLPACTRSGGGVVSRGLFMLTLEPPARAARVWRPLAHANYMQVRHSGQISVVIAIVVDFSC